MLPGQCKPTIKQRIAQNIALAMREQGVGPGGLSQITGQHERAIRRWRNGEVTPGEDNLVLLAVGLKRESVDWFYVDHDAQAAAA
jgi:hypothetical protein